MLTTEHLKQFAEDGYFVYPGCLSERAVRNLRAETDICAADREDPGLVREKDGDTVRGMHGIHLRNEMMSKLCRHPTLLALAKGVLGEDVYVHQFKLNIKAAFVGDVWEWHQDMTFYHREDEVPHPHFLTIAVLLDDVTEFNGPLLLIPGSHKEGFKDSNKHTIEAYDAESSWLSNTTAKLRYTVEHDTLRRLVHTHGLAAPKGKAGDIIVFHANVFHGSGVNMSPFDRRVAFISYNSVKNPPQPTRAQRPEFLCARNCAALQPCHDEVLM
ncbi:phytanoyl-CoA dioxygenase family protein [Pseudoduganella violacea]|uniref:Ectoine hydroxylase n=1 Tax=Pseudoduganella violacea TaxID=1715466 RepID=A0A7W5FSR2_9BURK|nr:phytanoyl-CoA dioxygenase family protein [Pseudoduganella violacea]MBB3118010.1 ectoine hydroxylase [Pseudoduganella violacea]